MELQRKISILADAAKYDASCASSGGKRKFHNGLGNTEGMGICHSYTPDGRCVSLLKILLTNFCIFDCSYCINRISSDVPRARFTVEEVVQLTLDFYKRNYIEGLFLSSGVLQSPDHTMEELIEVGRRLREDHKFGGYIHLKAVAGASPDLLAKAGLWADRLSANIELPTESDLSRLAPAKTHGEIQASMNVIHERIVESKQVHADGAAGKTEPLFAPAGQSTQMIVGATPSSDATILAKASSLYSDFGLRRVYYSAFSPIPSADPRLPTSAPALIREHRLYQADWLLRFYGFQAGELTTAQNQDLDLRIDPKLAWALRHLEFFPVCVNTASKAALLRVPGLGARSVKKMLLARQFQKLTLADLGKLGVSLNTARYFVLTSDRNAAALEMESLNFSELFLPKAKPVSLFDFVEEPTAAG